MTAVPINPNDPYAYISGDGLHIHLTEVDPTVLRVVGEADDTVASVHKLLAFGAQGVLVANATADTTVLSDTVIRLTDTIEDSVGNAVTGITEAAEALLDAESGELPKAFATFKAQFESMLDENLNPDSKSSLIAKFENVLTAAAEEQTARLNRLLDPHSADSPLGRWRADLSKVVKDESAVIAKQVTDLSEKLAAEGAAAAAGKAMFNKTTAKGFKFEDVAEVIIGGIAGGHGDLAHRVSTETGTSGTKDGDEVVILSTEDTRGEHACFVWEFKDKKMSLKKILDELDDGMANREASFGIAVFGTESYAPTTVPFMWHGNKAILTVDKDTPEASLFNLAYMTARWAVRRDLADNGDSVDVARVESLIDEAQRGISRITQVRKCHTTAKKGIDDAATQVDILFREVESVLNSLRKEIDKG